MGETQVRPRLKYRWVVMMMDFAVLGLSYSDRTVISLCAVFIIKEFGFSTSTFGLVLSIFYIGYAPWAWIGGHLSDRFGPRNILALAVTWWSVFTGLTALGFNLASFLIIRFLFGFGEGPQASVSSKAMVNWFPKRELGTAIGVTNAGPQLGAAITAPIVVAILEATHDNWRIPFIVLGIVGLLIALGWYVVVRDKPEDHARVSVAERDEIVAKRSAAVDHATVVDDEDAPSMWRYIREPLVIANGIAFFAYAWVLYDFLSWFPVYLLDAQKINLSSLAWAGALPWVGGFIATILGGVLSDWLAAKTGNAAGSRKAVIIVGLGVTAVLMAFSATAGSVDTAVILMVGVILFATVTDVQFWTLIADVVPSSRYGGVAGFSHFIANLAGISAPYIVGLIVDQTHSWPLTFDVGAIISAVGALAMLLFGNVGRVRALSHPAVAAPPASAPPASV